MSFGRRHDHSSGISIGGDNSAPIQNVVGQNISQTHQSTHREPVTVEDLHTLLTSFRRDLDDHAGTLRNEQALRALTADIETTLATPTSRGALQSALQALPPLVVGTAVQQGGEALAGALAAWLG
ncbi:hypothetical protein [Streptomyces sp. NPDC054756]